MGAAGSRDDDFTAFVLARSARLMHFARMLCGDAGLAEDLVQTALEKAYLRWDRIEMADPFAYVRQAVVNQHLSWVRRRLWRERPSGDPMDLEPWAGALSDSAGLSDRRLALLSALRLLTRRERAVVVLRHVEDLSEGDTAAVLGVAVGTVKSSNARALRKLRAAPALAGVGETV
ncbi:SigE family RNA polymerase sigma factor [Kribbella pratensis]|jgi:RNA polymerase sigma-70 factor (sigma-E family)|uniref:RNA polymerase sigma-70 factor (Sigma-E family) n=1 Tax=Kribbella pratensis TaxID=2512112 RepID=A0A4V3GG69_9ACTN|nr:SigE family RNA polymerase sigma factor [Kribbella pratensis]TDW70987.1 RNA polymerase sigma-70 factor (sigma-E family) [Kribbella pratensis]